MTDIFKELEKELDKDLKDLRLRKYKIVASIIISIPSLIAFGYFTNWQAVISLFFVLWAQNISNSLDK